jgi:hypothetical protein
MAAIPKATMALSTAGRGNNTEQLVMEKFPIWGRDGTEDPVFRGWIYSRELEFTRLPDSQTRAKIRVRSLAPKTAPDLPVISFFRRPCPV